MMYVQSLYYQLILYIIRKHAGLALDIRIVGALYGKQQRTDYHET